MEKIFMELAVEEALEAIEKGAGGPYGAVIVKGYRIIAAGHSTVLKTNDPTAHAEMNVIRLATKLLGRQDLGDCVLYTSSKPCPMCLSAAMLAGIKEIYYGCEREEVECLGLTATVVYDYFINPKNHEEILKLNCFFYDEAEVVFKKWEAKKDESK